MSFIIDQIGATIAGAVVLLVIIKSVFTFNQMNHSVRTLLALNTSANHITEVVDMMFLEPIGQYSISEDEIILSASRSEIVVNNKETGGIMTIKMNNEEGNNFLTITHNGLEEYNTSPVFFESAEVFTFLDKHNREVEPIAANLAEIYGIKVEMVLIAPGWKKDDPQPIRYPLTFWRSFKGLYLKDNIYAA